METNITLHTCMVDGKRVAYSSETEFLVQVGKGPKGAYHTRYRFKGDIRQAAFYYASINIGLGFKKRLLVPAFNKPVLARATS